MAKSSINFAKATSGGLHHNDRTEKHEPKYLLPKEYRLENEIDVSAIDAQLQLRELYSEASKNYRKITKQKLQATSYKWEAVINLNREHTMEDVQRLAKAIEVETGFTAVQVAIHRDEGHINERRVAQYNLHAHITFFTLEQGTGEQLYRRTIKASDRRMIEKELFMKDATLKKGEAGTEERKAFNKQVADEIKVRGLKVFDRDRLSQMQDLTAEVLGMERGKRGSTAIRLEHKQYKAMKQGEVAKQKDLKVEIKELREQLKAEKANREDYAKLEQLNRDLKARIRTKDLSKMELAEIKTNYFSMPKIDTEENIQPSKEAYPTVTTEYKTISNFPKVSDEYRQTEDVYLRSNSKIDDIVTTEKDWQYQFTQQRAKLKSVLLENLELDAQLEVLSEKHDILQEEHNTLQQAYDKLLDAFEKTKIHFKEAYEKLANKYKNLINKTNGEEDDLHRRNI